MTTTTAEHTRRSLPWYVKALAVLAAGAMIGSLLAFGAVPYLDARLNPPPSVEWRYPPVMRTTDGQYVARAMGKVSAIDASEAAAVYNGFSRTSALRADAGVLVTDAVGETQELAAAALVDRLNKVNAVLASWGE